MKVTVGNYFDVAEALYVLGRTVSGYRPGMSIQRLSNLYGKQGWSQDTIEAFDKEHFGVSEWIDWFLAADVPKNATETRKRIEKAEAELVEMLKTLDSNPEEG